MDAVLTRPAQKADRTLAIEVVSDVICPWCYVGKRRLEQAATLMKHDRHLSIQWRPFQLNPTMPNGGLDRRTYRTAKFGSWERSQALDAQVAAVGREVGITFRHDLMTRTPNTFDAHRLIWLAGHDGKQDEFVNECTALMKGFKEKQRRKPLEMNLIIRGRNGLELRSLEVKRTKLDLDLFYEDDFKEVDATINKRLNNNKDKGIVLLHGLPGTGKTTYLRYLIGKIKKRVLFVSPNIAGDITNPDFIQLLVSNPNSVLIIEDAENVIMDRKLSNNALVSNLLNISDGLLADFLNVQLICTFNNSLTLVDNALLRKGRLIAKYEFGKLGINKSQSLSKHFGFDTVINEPMTIAEIANQHEKAQEQSRVEIIGFRRTEILQS